jgi:ABC-type glutathione transport system ATPase component
MGFSRPRVNCIVETATAAELFEAPRHPSTRMLLDALQSGRDRALIRSRPQTGDAANDHVEHNAADGEAKLGDHWNPSARTTLTDIAAGLACGLHSSLDLSEPTNGEAHTCPEKTCSSVRPSPRRWLSPWPITQ